MAIRTATGQATIFDVTDGNNSISVVLSNESHNIPTDVDGNNPVMTGSGTTVYAFEGTSTLTYNGTATDFSGLANGEFFITATPTGVTLGNTNTDVFVDYTDITADTASVEFAISYKTATGVTGTVTKIQSLSKTRQGSVGKDAKMMSLSSDYIAFKEDKDGNITPENIVVTAKLSNVTGNVMWTTGTGTASGSKNETFTVNKNDILDGVEVITATVDGISDTITLIKISDGTDGIDGQKADYIQYAYITSEAAPSEPTDGTYDGTAETEPTSPAGYTALPEADVDYPNAVWVSYVRYTHNPVDDTWTQGTWSPPAIFSKKGQDAIGSSPLSAVLSNETHTLPVDQDGNALDAGPYTSSGTTVYVYEGNTALTAIDPATALANGQFKLSVSGIGITPGTITLNTIADHTNLSATSASVTITIDYQTSDGVTGQITKTQTIGTSKQGTEATSLRISSDYLTFGEDSEGSVTPAAISFEAITQGSIGPLSWTTTPNVDTGAGSTFSLSSTAFAANNSVKVTVTDGTYSDSTTIVRVKDGSDGSPGVSYTGTTEYYQLTATEVAPDRYSTGTTIHTNWSTTPQTPTSTNKYLWNFNRNSKSDATFTDSAVSLITQYVADGVGIDSITEEYQLHTSPTAAPTGTWQSSVAAAGTISDSLPYLWNKTTITYTDTTTSTTTTLIAAKGDKGTEGDDGSGWAYTTIAGNKPGTINQTTLDNAFGAVVSRTAVQNDVLFVTYDDTSQAYSYDGIDWSEAALTIDGDIIADGSVFASKLVVDQALIDKLTTGEIKITGYNNTTLIPSSDQIIIKGNNIQTSGVVNDWAQQAYSKEGYYSGAKVSWVNRTNTARYMIGLNTDPTNNAGFATIDYAWYPSGGNIAIYESGVSKGNFVTRAVQDGDVFEIIYDNSTVKYIMNGDVYRTVEVSPGLRFYMDSSWVNDMDVLVENVELTPLAGDNNTSKTAGAVGGWTLSPTAIYSGAEYTGEAFNTGAGITLKSTGGIHHENFYIDENGDAGFGGEVTVIKDTNNSVVFGGQGSSVINVRANGTDVFNATTSGAIYRGQVQGIDRITSAGVISQAVWDAKVPTFSASSNTGGDASLGSLPANVTLGSNSNSITIDPSNDNDVTISVDVSATRTITVDDTNQVPPQYLVEVIRTSGTQATVASQTITAVLSFIYKGQGLFDMTATLNEDLVFTETGITAGDKTTDALTYVVKISGPTNSPLFSMTNISLDGFSIYQTLISTSDTVDLANYGNLTTTNTWTGKQTYQATTSDRYPIKIAANSSTDLGMLGIEFAGQGTGAQKGWLKATHFDAESNGAGYSFHLTSTEATTNLIVAGGVVPQVNRAWSWSAVQTFNVNPYIANTNPVLLMKDTNHAAGSSMTGWISFRDMNDSERAYVGFGSSSNTSFFVTNNDGYVVANGASGVLLQDSGSNILLAHTSAVTLYKILHADNNVRVGGSGGCTMEYNATTESMDFVFG